MKRKSLFLAAVVLSLSSYSAFAQNNVGIGTTTPNPNAVLEMQSTTQGVLVPRLTTAQRIAIAAPTEGLMVYDIDVNCFFFYESTSAAWQNLCSAGATGPQGPAGPAGPQGPAGVAGANGAPGAPGTNGVDGIDGATGPQGPVGAAGPQGPAGPAGTNGAAGATGATGPQGPPGVINKYHVYGTAGRLAVATTTPTAQPGMTQVVNLTATSSVMIWATIGGRTTGTGNANHAVVDMVIYVDGAFLPNGGWNRFTVTNPSTTNAFNTCAINTMVTLPAGAHTIELRTFRSSGTSPVDIGGNAASDVNPGEMSIMVLN